MSYTSSDVHLHTNRLSSEKSPYLLQHAHNPVDWYPWGPEAFEKAKREDKPILLSIGYSTCHWCHVMERESFEDEKTAEVMNRDYISVKVDREERPDIDSVYMSYVMTTTGSGGWPMTVFLTPDKKPFYGGTYFPPDNRYGMPGFKTLLAEIAEAWKTRRAEILESADSVVAHLGAPRTAQSHEGVLDAKTLEKAFEHFSSGFDAERGGFGRAPKFPRSHSLSFLLRYWKRTGSVAALGMVEKTLTEMAKGGVYDHLGGGFHRYSTDGEWRIPHFEKMLYDQALLVRTYVEAAQATGNAEYARVACETLDYVMREMTDREGGFYSAQDADSEDPHHPGHSREGAFFVWTTDEIRRILGADADFFMHRYGIEEAGNAIIDPHQEFEKQNVLYDARSTEKAAQQFGIDPEEASLKAASFRAKLFAARAKRKRPHLDDKILTDWNGLMIAAFAYAGAALDEPRYVTAAVKAARFISTKLKTSEGRLLHRWRDGDAAISANLNDYAALIYGFLTLYEATFDETWLAEARALTDRMVDLFWDTENHGFFLTAHDAEVLISRPKELYDGAVPSGNSFAALDLLLLSRYTMEVRYQKLADETLNAFAAELSAEPSSHPQMLIALDFAVGPSSEIVLAGDEKDTTLQTMMGEVRRPFMPNKIVLLHRTGRRGEALEAVAPFVKDKGLNGGKATAYICRNHVCSLPVTTAAEVRKRLTTR
jgi:hypothetical protein